MLYRQSKKKKKNEGFFYLLSRVVRPCCNVTSVKSCVLYRWPNRSYGIYICSCRWTRRAWHLPCTCSRPTRRFPVNNIFFPPSRIFRNFRMKKKKKTISLSFNNIIVTHVLPCTKSSVSRRRRLRKPTDSWPSSGIAYARSHHRPANRWVLEIVKKKSYYTLIFANNIRVQLVNGNR